MRKQKYTVKGYAISYAAIKGNSDMKKYYSGAKPYFEWEYRVNGTLTDPATSFTCAIYDNNGKSVGASEVLALTKSAVGIYYYAGWAIPTSALAGKYTCIATFTDTTHISRDKDTAIEFEVLKVGQ